MNREILMLVDVLARERNVDREAIFRALEFAMASATKKRLHEDADIRVNINRASGEYESFRRWQVVADDAVENIHSQVPLSKAITDMPDMQLNEFIEESIPPVDFGRIGAQAAKQAILQKVREAEREQLLTEFLERKEKIVSGTVRRMDRGGAVIEVGRMEAILPREHMILKENLRVGDRVQAYLLRIERNARGPQVILSRTAPEFVANLFSFEVPEIAEGLLEIKGVSREPGLRAKVAVKSNDPRVDPIGTCIGMRGSRVQAVINELDGERIDVVQWSEDPAQFAISALAPAAITSIVVDEESHSMDVVVDEENLPISIGRGGQNVRLATELTGWTINLMTEEESKNKYIEERKSALRTFVTQLEISEDLAQTLVDEGFTLIEQIAYVPAQELMGIQGLDAQTVEQLRERARNVFIERSLVEEEAVEGLSEELLKLEGMNPHLAKQFYKANVRSRSDLANLSVDELMEVVEVSHEQAGALISQARSHWFDNDTKTQ